MAKVISIRPRGVYVTLEISLENVKRLKAVLNKASIAPGTPLELEGADYLEEVFEPLLESIIEECE